MPSIQARMLNKIFQKMPKDPPGVEHDFVAEREQNARRKPPKLPRNGSLEEMDFDGISGENLRPGLGEKDRLEGEYRRSVRACTVDLVYSRRRIYHRISAGKPGSDPVSGIEIQGSLYRHELPPVAGTQMAGSSG